MPRHQQTAQDAITDPSEAQGTITPATEPETVPAAPSAAPQATVGETLSDAEKERIRGLVKASTGRRSGLYELPNGDGRMDITIPTEIFQALKAQAEGAEIPVEKYIQDSVVAALEMYYAAPA